MIEKKKDDDSTADPIDSVDSVDAHDTSDEPSAEQAESKPARRRAVSRGTSLRRPGTDADDKPSGGSPARGSRPATKADSDGEPADGEGNTQAPGGRDKLAYGLIGAAVVVGVLAAVVGIMRPGARPIDNDAFVNTALTSEVTSVAKQAATSIYTIDMNNLGEWEKGLGDVLTPGMIDEAKKQRAGITQTAGALPGVKVKVDDKDLVVGVAQATNNRAELLLNVSVQVQAEGTTSGSMQVPMKFVLDRFDGDWKVSSITQL